MVRYESCGASIFSAVFPILLADGRYMGITIRMMKVAKENIGILQGTILGYCRSILFRQNQS